MKICEIVQFTRATPGRSIVLHKILANLDQKYVVSHALLGKTKTDVTKHANRNVV